MKFDVFLLGVAFAALSVLLVQMGNYVPGIGCGVLAVGIYRYRHDL